MKDEAIFNLKVFKDRRVQLRKNQTEPEKKLWRGIRSSQLGVKFRRQHGIGNYIVDFYCSELSFVVELDGNSHFSEQALMYDQSRDHYFNQLGLKVVRFTNKEVMNNYEGVIVTLLGMIKNQPPPSLPLRRGRSKD